MLRDKSLVPLSRQHQHALALCVRIDRASPISHSDLAAWQAEITQLCQTEIEIHFVAEEKVVFPEARRFSQFVALVDDLLADHSALRGMFADAAVQKMSDASLSAVAQRLSAHIRKEERQLFEGLQEVLSAEELALMGRRLDEALAEAAQACILPSDATALRPSKAKST
jgi:iron-sulfur cluster repair protein YtfE (RIC family)